MLECLYCELKTAWHCCSRSSRFFRSSEHVYCLLFVLKYRKSPKRVEVFTILYIELAHTYRNIPDTAELEHATGNSIGRTGTSHPNISKRRTKMSENIHMELSMKKRNQGT